MAENLFVLWLAAFPLMGSPGPATMSIAAVGAAFGVRRGLPYLAGVAAGTTAVLLMIATGITGLVSTRPALLVAVQIAAAAYILFLAWRIATAPPVSKATADAPSPSFVAGFLLAIANPKAFAAIGAVYAGGSLVPDSLIGDAAAKVAALFAVIVIVHPAWLAFGAAISARLADPRASRVINIAFAAALVAAVALALLAG